MGKGILTKYSASAGSGKTFELTANYLSKLFASPQSYRRILAVTFTNKAAAEMKYKIISELYNFSKGKRNSMAGRLEKNTGLSFGALQEKSKHLLYSILHDYSFFHVGTIDSFFQKILRAFTREIGLQHGYLIEIEHKEILSKAIDATLEDSLNDKALLNWLTDFALEKAGTGRNWNIRNDISRLAGEIFNEKFRLISSTDREKLRDREFLNSYVVTLKSIRDVFSSDMAGYAMRCRAILDRHNVDDAMFYKGTSGGVGSFFKKIEKGVEEIWAPPANTVLKVLDDPPVWTAKTGPSPELKAAFADGFCELFTEALKYYRDNFIRANTAILISENIYVLGILSDILLNLHKITTSENRFLLSDAGDFLHRITGTSQTPFIYEKAGNIFEYFMIDEFQDTSVIQWNNFLPLIENSMAGGNDNLVVGDVKQSIYRWRNGDWKILGNQLQRQFDENRLKSETLSSNYRSLKNIIAFNNSLFSILPRLIDSENENDDIIYKTESLYTDVRQSCGNEKEGGFIRIEFIPEEDAGSFRERALAGIPALIEKLQDNGYSAGDIGILVRKNDEGSDVINSIITYRATVSPEKSLRYNYSIISGDSLFINSSPAAGFIISLLRFMVNPGDRISLAVMLRNWLCATGRNPVEKDLTYIENACDELWPEGWREFTENMKCRPVFEAVEYIIRFFSLGLRDENTAFLNAFQDCVLEFSVNNSTDIRSFLDWWDINGTGRSLALSDQQDSIRVMTIHKAKGLEFKAVILPFIDWPLGHGKKNPLMWITPGTEPFSNIGLLPVKYKKALEHSFFNTDYQNEKFLACIDNLNLLYVAFTRAKEVLTGFCPGDKAREKDSMAGWLEKAFKENISAPDEKPYLLLNGFYNEEAGVFIAGEMKKPEKEIPRGGEQEIRTECYFVNDGISRLRLKYHSENWFLKPDDHQQTKLNYGRLMHDIFATVMTLDDIKDAVSRMVLDGRISITEQDEIEKKIAGALSQPEIKGWFSPGLRVITETDILLPDGTQKRPDRVIISGDKATVIDFKFGGEREEYIRQVGNYRKLLLDMGYHHVEAFVWYVDENKVIKV